MKTYNPQEIEPKWQKYWEENSIFAASDFDKKPKKYILDMFPYPSAAGLHVGHPEGYTATDIFSRYLKMKGYNVLHPMGWDAFGLPAENYAIKTGTHPSIKTKENINTFKKQIKSIGLAYDWSREIDTTDPEYYKWTQWIFLRLFKNGLAYEDTAPINFCPSCKTGLANEEVSGGLCERCGFKVERKTIRQWILKITKYADRLLSDLEKLDWPESIKLMQKNWIGRSEGTNVQFCIKDTEAIIDVYTTRVDTIFSGTYLVLAPEHKIVQNLKTKISNFESVSDYIREANGKSDLERAELSDDKTGVELEGIKAINPANGEEIPVWISDFVLLQYGTGAVFGDAHDMRDFKMAKKYDIPLKVSIRPENEALWEEIKNFRKCFEDDGVLVNSGQFDNMSSAKARIEITDWLERNNYGKKAVSYKLRDWIFSRQRYWGEPIPIIHCSKCGAVPVPEDKLPVRLPDVENYEPSGTGDSPLAKIETWVNTTCPNCKGPGKRETNTMPQWAGSCWYYLRFIDPKNKDSLLSSDKEKYWMSVDLYVGGAEHAVLHLLYARFWHKFLFDIGVVSNDEPFIKLKNQGMILAQDGRKMSKSLGNVVNPDDIISCYGADTLRLYEMFMGPFEQLKKWDTKSIEGVSRFLKRVWALLEQKQLPSNKNNIILNNSTTRITNDIESFRFNTAISQLMILTSNMKDNGFSKKELESLLVLLSPFAPHISEEMWQILGHSKSISSEPWPEALGIDSTNEFTIAVQVDGKFRKSVSVNSEMQKDDLIEIILKIDKISRWITRDKIDKVFYVKNKIINLTTKKAKE